MPEVSMLADQGGKKTSIKVPYLHRIAWAPASHLLAYIEEKTEKIPAAIRVIKIPEREVVAYRHQMIVGYD